MADKQILLQTGEGPERVVEYLATVDKEKVYQVIIKPYKDRRSTSQNNLYWAYLSELQEQTGNDAEDLHVYFKSQILGAKERVMFGKKMKVAHTTTTLNTQEFTFYLRKIETIALENGYTLTQPGYYNYAMGYEK